MRHPSLGSRFAPTASLPPVARLSSQSSTDVERALDNLRNIYARCPLPNLPAPSSSLPKHVIHDMSAPDSGYASAEEDEDEDEDKQEPDSNNACGTFDDEDHCDVDILRSDALERDFAIRWLTAFTARSDAWAYALGITEEEQDARAALVDTAASLLASFAGDDDEEEALTRMFEFSVCGGRGRKVKVELNDAPLLSADHTSVGLQSWGSSIVFAERLCADPRAFNLGGIGLRVLELGAGTGLLSLAAAQLTTAAKIVATDYHPQVLENLRANVRTNAVPVAVAPLDWQSPTSAAPLDKPFDVILAADVVYQAEHARWIKTCVQRLLQRPSEGNEGGVFWLIIPVRSTGRHEGIADTVDAVFRSEAAVLADHLGEPAELAVRSVEVISKHDGVGRADEGSYRLFKIGWVES